MLWQADDSWSTIFLSPIQESSRQSWILDSTRWITDSRYWIPDSLSVELAFQIPVVSGTRGFFELYYGFQSPGFRICIDNSMICSDISRAVRWQFLAVTSGMYAKHHVQITLLFVYTTTRSSFVIFTCRYSKLSWNTTALRQSNSRNLSCSITQEQLRGFQFPQEKHFPDIRKPDTPSWGNALGPNSVWHISFLQEN